MGKSLRCLAAVVLAATIPLSAGCGSSNPLGGGTLSGDMKSLVVGSAGGSPSAVGSHSFKARAGHHLAPQTLSSGRNVFEELGEGFTLLAFGAAEPDIAAFEAAARARQIPLKVLRHP